MPNSSGIDAKGAVRARRPSRNARVLLPVLFAAACASPPTVIHLAAEESITLPSKVAYEYHCELRPLPFFEFERGEVDPVRVRPGSGTTYELVYVMCPSEPTVVVSGTLDILVFYRGDVVMQHSFVHDLRPGRWRVDTGIPIADTLPPGAYAVEARFSSAEGEADDRRDFVVKDR